jgi:hypothetical protein
MTAIGWKSCLLWTAHTPCGVNSLRKSNQIKSNQIKIAADHLGIAEGRLIASIHNLWG